MLRETPRWWLHKAREAGGRELGSHPITILRMEESTSNHLKDPQTEGFRSVQEDIGQTVEDDPQMAASVSSSDPSGWSQSKRSRTTPDTSLISMDYYTNSFFSLPYEVLSTIFFMTRAHYPPGQTAGWHRFELPFIVSQVCHQWRFIALKEEKLWNYIFYDDKNLAMSLLLQSTSLLPLYQAAFHRSGATELEVELGLRRPLEEYKASTGWPFLLSTLPAQSSRWRSLRLTCAHGDVINVICSAFPRQLPQLTDLVLTLTGRDDWEAIAFGVDCPRLMSMTLHGIYFTQESWQQGTFPMVKSISCHAISIIQAILSRALPSMKHLQINGGVIDSSERRIIHNLHSLSFSMHSAWVNMTMTIGALRAPDLQVICLKFDGVSLREQENIAWGYHLDRAYPALNTVVIYLAADAIWDYIKAIVKAFRYAHHWVIWGDATWFAQGFSIEKVVQHISIITKDSGPHGVSVTVMKPSLPKLRYYLIRTTIKLCLYHDDFDLENDETRQQLAKLREVAMVEFVDKPEDALEGVLGEEVPWTIVSDTTNIV